MPPDGGGREHYMKRRGKLVTGFIILCVVLAAALFVPKSVQAANSDFVIDEDGVLTEYTGSGGDVVIPDGVTGIGDDAFFYCSSLTSIEIPASVTSIGNSAFSGCDSLTGITIPANVTSIGSGVISGCSSLAEIQVEDGNTVYDSRGGSNAIIETTGNRLIAGCKNTSIPAGVTSIGRGAFENCDGLTDIVLPSGVISIEEWAFSYCSSLTSIEIPASVTDIGEMAFVACNDLRSIQVAAGNKTYDSRDGSNAIIETAANLLIVGCKNTRIPSSVTGIGDEAFYGCDGLSDIVIPGSVKHIGDGAFGLCASLKSVVIPEGVTSIGDSAFFWCSMTSVTISSSVTVIGDRAFGMCDKIQEITILNPKTKLGNSKGDAIFDNSMGYGITFQSPVVTIKGYTNSTAQELVNYMNNTSSVRFQFIALDKANGNLQASANLTAQLLQKVKIAKKLTIKQGRTKTIKVKLPKGLKKVKKFSGINKKGQVKITYKSSNKKVASVNSKGKVKAKKKGTAKITVSMSVHDGKNVLNRKLIVKVKVK